MLVLSRKRQESVVVGGTVGLERVLKITVLHVRGGVVRLGFEGPAQITVHRLEVLEDRIPAGSQPGRTRRRPRRSTICETAVSRDVHGDNVLHQIE